MELMRINSRLIITFGPIHMMENDWKEVLSVVFINHRLINPDWLIFD